MKTLTKTILYLLLFSAPSATWAKAEAYRLRVPAGFAIEVFADRLTNARTMVETANRTLFVGTRSAGNVYAVKNGKNYTIANGLNMPNGIAFHNGSLYVAEVHRIWRMDNIEASLDKPPKPVIIRNDLPNSTHHGWRYIDFGPDGRLYLSIGAPCNVCKEGNYAHIRSMKPDGSDERIEATGIRNSVGFTWHPKTKKLWFSDNGRDWLGDDIPPDEINRIDQPGQHFGFPHCHGGSIHDPEFDQRTCDEFSPPALALGAHVAPLGIAFYTHNQFPAQYRGQLFVAEHGSWNKSSKTGYRVGVAQLQEQKVVNYKTFVSGWLNKDKAWGRPAYVLGAADGSLLISDDRSGTIFKVRYTGK